MNGIDGSLGTASSLLNSKGNVRGSKICGSREVRRRSTACPEILMAIWPICLSPVASLAMWPPLRFCWPRRAGSPPAELAPGGKSRRGE